MIDREQFFGFGRQTRPAHITFKRRRRPSPVEARSQPADGPRQCLAVVRYSACNRSQPSAGSFAIAAATSSQPKPRNGMPSTRGSRPTIEMARSVSRSKPAVLQTPYHTSGAFKRVRGRWDRRRRDSGPTHDCCPSTRTALDNPEPSFDPVRVYGRFQTGTAIRTAVFQPASPRPKRSLRFRDGGCS
jgi:hypothetical protein